MVKPHLAFGLKKKVGLRKKIHNKMYHLMTFIKSIITCIVARNKNNELLQFITKQKQIYIENNIKIIVYFFYEN